MTAKTVKRVGIDMYFLDKPIQMIIREVVCILDDMHDDDVDDAGDKCSACICQGHLYDVLAVLDAKGVGTKDDNNGMRLSNTHIIKKQKKYKQCGDCEHFIYTPSFDCNFQYKGKDMSPVKKACMYFIRKDVKTDDNTNT